LLSIHDHLGWSEWQEHIIALPESGGTAGPLPDGTVIEVKHASWPSLAVQSAAAEPTDHEKRRLIAAFNARGARA
jgi:hypothetical protein